MSLVTMDADGFRQVIEALRSGEPVVVLDRDALRRGSGQHRSTTMVRVGCDGELAFVRAGIQDALTAGGDAGAYLEDLIGRATTYGDEKEA